MRKFHKDHLDGHGTLGSMRHLAPYIKAHTASIYIYIALTDQRNSGTHAASSPQALYEQHGQKKHREMGAQLLLVIRSTPVRSLQQMKLCWDDGTDEIYDNSMSCRSRIAYEGTDLGKA